MTLKLVPQTGDVFTEGEIASAQCGNLVIKLCGETHRMISISRGSNGALDLTVSGPKIPNERMVMEDVLRSDVSIKARALLHWPPPGTSA